MEEGAQELLPLAEEATGDGQLAGSLFISWMQPLINYPCSNRWSRPMNIQAALSVINGLGAGVLVGLGKELEGMDLI